MLAGAVMPFLALWALLRSRYVQTPANVFCVIHLLYSSLRILVSLKVYETKSLWVTGFVALDQNRNDGTKPWKEFLQLLFFDIRHQVFNVDVGESLFGFLDAMLLSFAFWYMMADKPGYCLERKQFLFQSLGILTILCYTPLFRLHAELHSRPLRWYHSWQSHILLTGRSRQ